MIRKTLAVVAVAALVGVAAGSALAAGGPGKGAGAPAWAGTNCTGAGPAGVQGAPMAAAATYLGLTQTELRAQKAAGKTLAQIAVDKGKTVAGLKAAMIAAVEKNLDAAVAAGRITAAQAADRLALMQDRIDTLVNVAGGMGYGFRGGR